MMSSSTTKELYEKIVLHYQRWYSTPINIIERDIVKIMNREGVSRTEAIHLLYKRIYGELPTRSENLENELRKYREYLGKLDELYRRGELSEKVYKVLKEYYTNRIEKIWSEKK